MGYSYQTLHPDNLVLTERFRAGMNWLHCLKPEPIIHRDLKPPNVLVTKDFEVKVCDFGLSCVKEKFDPKAPPKDKAVGTPVWMSPEILCGLPASEKSDVYAYGLVLWVMPHLIPLLFTAGLISNTRNRNSSPGRRDHSLM